MNLGLVYTFISVVTYALYAIGLKPFKERMVLFFWINIFSYLSYLGFYFFTTVIQEHEPNPIYKLLNEFTFTNVPFYLLMACMWVGSLIILNHLLDNYDVSLVIPVTEVSILFCTLGYIALGTKFVWVSLIGVLVVFIGAVLSAFDKLSLKNPLGPLMKIPHALIIGGTLEAFLSSGSKWITFICTHQTAVTLGIHHWINNLFLHIYKMPFSFRNPFYYNVGVRFFIGVVFLAYMILVRNKRWIILQTLRAHLLYILGMSILFTLSIVTYHAAFFILEDKQVLTALSKLSIPLILIIGKIALKEKITPPKIAGCILIVAGGLISFIF